MNNQEMFVNAADKLPSKPLPTIAREGGLAKDENGIMHVFMQGKWIEFQAASKMVFVIDK
jgi:hypothetical protein